MLAKILVLLTLMSCSVHAADVCSLFPHLGDFDGKAVAVTGEILVAPEALAITGLCIEPYVATLPGYRVLREWPSALQIDLDSGLQEADRQRVAEAQAAARAAIKRGTFLRATGQIEGVVEIKLHVQGSAYGPDGTFPGRLIVTRVLDLTWQEQALGRNLAVMSVCDLFRDLPSHRGQRVAVRGVLSRTAEGTWLSAGKDCPYRFETDGYAWGHDLALGGWSGVSARAFSGLTRSSLPGTNPPFGPMGPTTPTTVVTVVGVINTREQYTVICRFGELRAFGFGHLSGAPGALSVEEAFDPIVEEREWLIAQPRQTCQETPTK